MNPSLQPIYLPTHLSRQQSSGRAQFGLLDQEAGAQGAAAVSAGHDI
jgi:hypothetical protein